VERVIDEHIRPSLRMDGGDVQIMDIKGTLVYCSLRGACSSCAGASQTLKMLVERSLKDQVDERIRVIEV
jgi:NifU-like protein